MTTPDLMAHAQRLLDENRYLTLGTTSSDGRPRTSPVYFAADGVQDFYWISGVDARHSRNLTERPPVSLVVLDSAAAPYEGRAVYATGHARELTGDEMAAGLAVDPAPNLPRVPP